MQRMTWGTLVTLLAMACALGCTTSVPDGEGTSVPNGEGTSVPDRDGTSVPAEEVVSGEVASVPEVGGGEEVAGCPVAVIEIAEGEEVVPQTTLHLSGDESYASSGAVVKWEWSVEQPVGSVSQLIPAASFPNPTFEVTVAGKYVFRLKVWDEAGQESCEEAVAVVTTCCSGAIHVELLWQTPGDPDETDHGPQAGSNLDLHFLHPWADGPDLDGDGVKDGWFDIPFDCFWFNAHPNWGSYDPAVDDDPALDVDDTDGGGPENINLAHPEPVVYRVGVHYWADNGYGAALATVRVWVWDQLVFKMDGVEMVEDDIWEVCTIEWPSGKVEGVLDGDGGPKILSDYANPWFFR